MSTKAASKPAPYTSAEIAAASQKWVVNREDEFADLAWLKRSFEDPEGFFRALFERWAERGTAPKSRPFERYDLYHDMIVRNLGSARPALSFYDRLSRKVVTVSYAELHVASAAKAGEWAAQKVKAGDGLAVVLPFGRDLVVALLAALRLGVIAAFLPPLGSLYLKKRLAKLKAAHIATDPLYRTLLAGQEKLILADGQTATRPYDRSFTFASKEICANVFSPLREPLDTPVPLAIDSAFFLALRDALVTFSLGPGDVTAAPDMPPTQHHPALLFATLLVGGTFFEVTLSDLTQDPKLLLTFPLRCLGVTKAVRDLLVSKPIGALPTIAHWWKNPEEPFDAAAWGAFADGAGLSKVPASNVVVDAASGGATLFSVRRPRGQNLRVLPAAGGPWVVVPPLPPPWALYDVDASGKLATGEFGLFAPAPTKKPGAIGHVLLANASGGEQVYGGTLSPRRSGRVYPTSEVLEAISKLPFNQGACVITVPSGGAAPASLFVLLVFTGAEDISKTASEEGARTSAILRAVEVLCGPGSAPDRIFYYPLYPRMKGPLMDEAWCEAQYHLGSLARKASEGVFQKLTMVRKQFVKDFEIA